GLHVAVVVGVARVDLIHLVIDVGDRALLGHPGQAHRLELQQRHVAIGVGEQDLVDADADLVAGHGLAGDEVAFDQLAREAQTHGASRQARRYHGWPPPTRGESRAWGGSMPFRARARWVSTLLA